MLWKVISPTYRKEESSGRKVFTEDHEALVNATDEGDAIAKATRQIHAEGQHDVNLIPTKRQFATQVK